MNTQTEGDKPKLASLVQAGEGQTAAEPINDFIFMVKDISNAYLVNTDDGDVLINTGFMGEAAERNKALLEPVRSGPLRAIILTQAHPDHFGGVPALREADTRVIAHRDFPNTKAYFDDLGPYIKRRSGKLWSGTIKGRGTPVPHVEPDVTFEDSHTETVGNRRFQVLSTPGGESLDASVVWMPDDGVVFTGNLFGPVFMSMPNLNTIRGDKPRSVDRFLDSLNRVRALGADLLITGHGEPVRGAERIRADLDKLHDAVAWVRDATIEGMNAGKDVHTLMREIELPEHLKIGEFHGKVSWAVRTIWEGYSGWFHYDSTAALYGVPRSSIDGDLAELAGGAEALANRARQKLDSSRPLEAIHLTDIALGAVPDNREALTVKKAALELLLEASGGTNLSETMWLKSEIAEAERALGEQG